MTAVGTIPPARGFSSRTTGLFKERVPLLTLRDDRHGFCCTEIEMVRHRLVLLMVAVAVMCRSAVPLSAGTSTVCPMAAHDCCPAVLTCCSPDAPSSVPATLPASTQTVQSSAQTALTPVAAVWDASPDPDGAHSFRSSRTHDLRQVDLVVFLAVFLI
jgi:hypothetical protein